MTKKSYRDPGAPKRNLSAYLLYQHGMREQFRAQNPGMTFGQLAKYTSAMYAEMPVAEKEAWQARAEADKARYLHELSSYIPPPGYDAKGDAILSIQGKSPGKRPKVNRDPTAPKRNMSAYLIFQNTMRDHYKRQNPGLTFGQLAQHTSKEYKKLTPEEKAVWSQKADEDKARYDAGIAVYVPPPGYDAHGNLIDAQFNKRPRKAVKDPEAPKRARGSFVFFTFEMRPQVMAEFPDIKFVEMGNVLGQRWRALSVEQKKKYEDMAAGDKVRFHMEMQQYAGKLNQIQAQAHQARAQAIVNQHMAHAQPTPTGGAPQPYPQYSSMEAYQAPPPFPPQSYEQQPTQPAQEQQEQQQQVHLKQEHQEGQLQQQQHQHPPQHQQQVLLKQEYQEVQLQQQQHQHPPQHQQSQQHQLPPQQPPAYAPPTSTYEASV